MKKKKLVIFSLGDSNARFAQSIKEGLKLCETEEDKKILKKIHKEWKKK